MGGAGTWSAQGGRDWTGHMCGERRQNPGHGRGVHRWTSRRRRLPPSASSARWSRNRRRGSRQSSGETYLTWPFQAVRGTWSQNERESAGERRWMNFPCEWCHAPGFASAARALETWAWRLPGARSRSASTAFFQWDLMVPWARETFFARTTLRSQQHVTRSASRCSFLSSRAQQAARGLSVAPNRVFKSALPRRKSRSGSNGHVTTYQVTPDIRAKEWSHWSLESSLDIRGRRRRLRSPLVFQRREEEAEGGGVCSQG